MFKNGKVFNTVNHLLLKVFYFQVTYTMYRFTAFYFREKPAYLPYMHVIDIIAEFYICETIIFMNIMNIKRSQIKDSLQQFLQFILFNLGLNY